MTVTQSVPIHRLSAAEYTTFLIDLQMGYGGVPGIMRFRTPADKWWANSMRAVMQMLCGKVVELLRKHPILWLPYIAADLLAILLWHLRGLAEKGIFHRFTTGDSALQGDIHAKLAKASIAYAPIGILTIVAVVFLFVAALVATAGIVDAIQKEQRANTDIILAILVERWRRILLFALRFLITVGVFVGGTGGLSYYFLSRAHRQDFIASFWFPAVEMLIGFGCTGWLVVPAAIRLLRGAAAVVSAHARNQGTILTIMAAEAGAALGFFVPKMESSLLLNGRLENTVLAIFNSAIANAPDELLFIALALLAADLTLETEGKKDHKIRELLSILMPLHFGRSKTPPE